MIKQLGLLALLAFSVSHAEQQAVAIAAWWSRHH